MKAIYIKLSAALLMTVCMAAAGIAEARHYNRHHGCRSGSCMKHQKVKGYYRSNGVYVAPHYRSSKDGYHNNNWSVEGNVNPHTGRPGYKKRWKKRSEQHWTYRWMCHLPIGKCIFIICLFSVQSVNRSCCTNRNISSVWN